MKKEVEVSIGETTNSKEIVARLYKNWGDENRILFGITNKAVVRTIVEFVLHQSKTLNGK